MLSQLPLREPVSSVGAGTPKGPRGTYLPDAFMLPWKSLPSLPPPPLHPQNRAPTVYYSSYWYAVLQTTAQGKAEPMSPGQVTALLPNQLECHLCPTVCHDNVTT